MASKSCFHPIKLESRNRHILRSSTLMLEYVPPKSLPHLFEDCVKTVELEFGKYSKKTSVFKKLLQDCKERRITIREIASRTDKLFKDHPTLYIIFGKTVLPYLYPVSTWDEVVKANQFIHAVEAAFPGNQNCWYAVEILIRSFQNGTLSLKDMTVKMLKLMDDRDDLIEAYIKFVPQAEHVIADITSTRRFISYFAITAIIVAFGIGFYTMKN